MPQAYPRPVAPTVRIRVRVRLTVRLDLMVGLGLKLGLGLELELRLGLGENFIFRVRVRAWNRAWNLPIQLRSFGSHDGLRILTLVDHSLSP